MKDLSTQSKNDRKTWMIITITIFTGCLIFTACEFIFKQSIYSISAVIIEIINVWILPLIKKQYHRGEQILKIFENCTEQDKEEIYNFVKKYDHTETH